MTALYHFFSKSALRCKATNDKKKNDAFHSYNQFIHREGLQTFDFASYEEGQPFFTKNELFRSKRGSTITELAATSPLDKT